MDKQDVINRLIMKDIYKYYGSKNLEYDIIKKMQEEDERKALAKVLENERTLLLTDCGIIAHPKYKGVLPQVLESLEVKIPVVWSGMVEEQKIYLVTEEWLVQRMKEVEE